MQSIKSTYKLWSDKSSSEEDALEPDVIEMPSDENREPADNGGDGARIIVLNPRRDSEASKLDGEFKDVLSPWDILHLRWRLREILAIHIIRPSLLVPSDWHSRHSLGRHS